MELQNGLSRQKSRQMTHDDTSERLPPVPRFASKLLAVSRTQSHLSPICYSKDLLPSFMKESGISSHPLKKFPETNNDLESWLSHIAYQVQRSTGALNGSGQPLAASPRERGSPYCGPGIMANEPMPSEQGSTKITRCYRTTHLVEMKMNFLY